MFSKKIKFKKNSNDSKVARFGGKSYLPNEIDWPLNEYGDKLALLFSIPTSFINENCNTNFDNDKYISVFSTYMEDYFLDDVIDNGDIDFILKNTKVILHSKSELRNEFLFEFPVYDILIGESIEKDSENLEMTKIGGSPNFLQNPVKTTENMTFCFQFYANDLPEFNNVLFLDDAIGYLFVLNDNNNFVGYFFGQCT